MTATEELLRLARKAWPDSERITVSVDGADDRNPFVEAYLEDDGYRCVEIARHDLAQQALHAALHVLAGELDVAALQAQSAALVAERDRLRAGIADTIEAMNDAKAAKSAPGNEAYDEGFNAACGFARQLQAVLDYAKEQP